MARAKLGSRGAGFARVLGQGRGSEQHLPAAAGSGSLGSATSEGRGLPVPPYSALQCSGRRGPDALPQSCGRLAGGEGGWRGSGAVPEGRPSRTSADRDTGPWMACLGFPSCKLTETCASVDAGVLRLCGVLSTFECFAAFPGDRGSDKVAPFLPCSSNRLIFILYAGHILWL